MASSPHTEPQPVQWLWWAVDRRGRVAVFDAGAHGPVPWQLRHTHRRRELERGALHRFVLGLPTGLRPHLDLHDVFSTLTGTRVFTSPAQLEAHSEFLLELTDPAPARDPTRLAQLREHTGARGRLRELNSKPLLFWLRAPDTWLAEHWTALGVRRALAPFVLPPERLGSFRYRYDLARERYVCAAAPAHRVLRIEQLPAAHSHLFRSLDTDFGLGAEWSVPEHYSSYYAPTPAAFVARVPKFRR